MGVETTQPTQIEAGFKASKPEAQTVQPVTISSAEAEALKKWGASTLEEANENSRAFDNGVAEDVRAEIAALSKPKIEATFTGSGYQEGKKLDNAVSFTGAGYDAQAARTGEKPLVGSGYDKNARADGESKGEKSDADILTEENGYLGVREAYVNWLFASTPKGMIPPGETQFVDHPDGKGKAAWRLIKTIADPRSWLRDLRMEDTTDSPTGGKQVLGRVRNGVAEKPPTAPMHITPPAAPLAQAA